MGSFREAFLQLLSVAQNLDLLLSWGPITATFIEMSGHKDEVKNYKQLINQWIFQRTQNSNENHKTFNPQVQNEEFDGSALLACPPSSLSFCCFPVILLSTNTSRSQGWSHDFPLFLPPSPSWSLSSLFPLPSNRISRSRSDLKLSRQV